MDSNLERALTRLDKDAIVRIDAGQGDTVVVFHGQVWITQDDDPRDVVLRAGESFTLDRPGTALVQALAESSLLIDRHERSSGAIDVPQPASLLRRRWSPARLVAAVAVLAVASGASQVFLAPPALAAASASVGVLPCDFAAGDKAATRPATGA